MSLPRGRIRTLFCDSKRAEHAGERCIVDVLFLRHFPCRSRLLVRREMVPRSENRALRTLSIATANERCAQIPMASFKLLSGDARKVFPGPGKDQTGIRKSPIKPAGVAGVRYHPSSSFRTFLASPEHLGRPMTISMTDYFRTRQSDRKKETRYINVINKDNCTSCNSCAAVLSGRLHLRSGEPGSVRKLPPDRHDSLHRLSDVLSIAE